MTFDRVPEASAALSTLGYSEPYHFAGVTYTGMGRYQLHAIHGGRYFIVCGDLRRGYTLLERSAEAGAQDGAAWPRHVEMDSPETIGRKFDRLIDVAAVSAEIERLVAKRETLPVDTRHPRAIDAARYRASEAALTAQRVSARLPATPQP